MASIRKRETLTGTTFEVVIRIKGNPTLYKAFKDHASAQEWAKKTEEALRSEEFQLQPTLKMAFDRYEMEILPTKSVGMQSDEITHMKFWNEHLGNEKLHDLKSSQIEDTANLLYQRISRNTKMPLTYESRRKYLATLSYLFSVAIKNWRWVDYNPVIFVNKHIPSKKEKKEKQSEVCPIKSKLLQEITNLMKDQNLTVSSLAWKMKISKTTVQHIFDPEVNLTFKMLLKVCNALGKKIELKIRDSNEQ